MSFSQFIPEHIQRIPPYKSENPAEEIERKLGVVVVQLGMNENPFGPSPKAVHAARGFLEKIAPYPDDSAYFLRQRLASHYKISMDEIIVSSGSSDILAMTYDAFHTLGSEVLTGEASFVVYYQLAEILNMPLVRTPMKEYAFDLEAMAERVTSRTRLVVLANPNNPTGTIIGRAALAAWDDREHVQKSVSMNRAELEFLYHELSKRGVRYVPSHANFVLVELKKPAREVTSALLNQGVIVRPAWGCPACIRVSVGTHEQNQAFLTALDKVL